jgi:type IX secretion system PorP/SprF family membrane protein
MYRFNGLYINPAYAGSHDVISTSAIYRYQWVKMPGAPQTASVAIHSPLNNNHIALGLVYTYDRIGVTQTNTLNAAFAYRICVGKTKQVKLSFGISAGFDNYRADLNSINTATPNDPGFAGNSQNRWLPNVGAGFYAYSEKFFAGIAVPRILANKLNGPAALFATSTGIARQYHHLLITAGYVFILGSKVKLLPSVLIKYVPAYAPVTFDFNANFIFVDRVWLGAGYRFNDSYNFMMAVNITRQFKVGYCYDLTVSALGKYTTGSHEVVLSFDAAMQHRHVVSPRQVSYF